MVWISCSNGNAILSRALVFSVCGSCVEVTLVELNFFKETYSSWLLERFREINGSLRVFDPLLALPSKIDLLDYIYIYSRQSWRKKGEKNVNQSNQST